MTFASILDSGRQMGRRKVLNNENEIYELANFSPCSVVYRMKIGLKKIIFCLLSNVPNVFPVPLTCVGL